MVVVKAWETVVGDEARMGTEAPRAGAVAPRYVCSSRERHQDTRAKSRSAPLGLLAHVIKRGQAT